MKNKMILFLYTLFIVSICFEYVSFAIEKPSYEDYIRSQYGEELSDEQVKSIITAEKFGDMLKDLPKNIRKEFFGDNYNTKEITDTISKTKQEKEKNEESNVSNKVGNDKINHETNLPNDKTELINIELKYSDYPELYGGKNNYKRKNFLLMAYSLRDVDVKEGMQPVLTSGNNNNVFRKIGFDTLLWQNKESALSSYELLKWIMYQFEPSKIFNQNDDNINRFYISKTLYEKNIQKFITKKSNNIIIKIEVDNKQLYNCKPGDILLYVEKNKVKDYGIFVGKDEEGDYYGLALHKNVNNINTLEKSSYNYMTEVFALSYINSDKVYPQDINGKMNLITGTNYNYIVKMDFEG